MASRAGRVAVVRVWSRVQKHEFGDGFQCAAYNRRVGHTARCPAGRSSCIGSIGAGSSGRGDGTGRARTVTTESDDALTNFAGLFLRFNCKNALFLDGDISAMAVNPKKPIESNLFGAMWVVAE